MSSTLFLLFRMDDRKQKANLSEEDLNFLWVAYQLERKRTAVGSYGFVKRVNSRFSEMSTCAVLNRKTVTSHIKIWEGCGGTRSPRKKTPQKRKFQKSLSDEGDIAMRSAIVAKKLNYRGIARSGMTFESPTGQQVSVSRYAARRISREGKQVLSVRK